MIKDKNYVFCLKDDNNLLKCININILINL